MAEAAVLKALGAAGAAAATVVVSKAYQAAMAGVDLAAEA